MTQSGVVVIGANQAVSPKGVIYSHTLDYRSRAECSHSINVNLKTFASYLLHVPDRIIDLLELAAYVFTIDRMVSRGPTKAVEFQKWSRKIEVHLRVRDFNFWNQAETQKALTTALNYITGDASWIFKFQSGINHERTGLFDTPDHDLAQTIPESEIMLFSGGADSLAGALEILSSTQKHVILVSHQSSPQITKTQRSLVNGFRKIYGDRCHHFQFECNLKGQPRPPEETQRSRAFLFCSIGFALAVSMEKSNFKVFENGITSINLSRRADLINARASRTTNPKAINLLSGFFSLFGNNEFHIELPYLNCTKTDVIEKIVKFGPNLLTSCVSCTRPSFDKGESTHCGTCFQCVDRRLAVFASDNNYEEQTGLYNFDLARDSMDSSTKTTAIDFVRQALNIRKRGPDYLVEEFPVEIAEVIEYFPFGETESDRINSLWDLYKRHGDSIRNAIDNMRLIFDDPTEPSPGKDTFLSVVATREYLKSETERFIKSLMDILDSVSIMFTKNRPKNENDLNSKMAALLQSHHKRFQAEHPTESFACARVIPDHDIESLDNRHSILIEAKYIRTNTTPSIVTEAIAADMTKFPTDKYVIFLVYDPDHKIPNNEIFISDIERVSRFKVKIVR